MNAALKQEIQDLDNAQEQVKLTKEYILMLSLLKVPNWIKLKNKQHHSKVLLSNSFPTNGHTLGFCTWSQKLETFVSPKVSLWESKG